MRLTTRAFECWRCGSWIHKETCGNWGVSKAVVRLTDGVSVSATYVSPAAATGDHRSTEMPPPALKWLATFPGFLLSTPHRKPLSFYISPLINRRLRGVRDWGKLLHMYWDGAAGAERWWKTAGVSRVNLFSLKHESVIYVTPRCLQQVKMCPALHSCMFSIVLGWVVLWEMWMADL